MPQHKATETKYVSGDFDISGIKTRLDKALGSQISADTAFSEGLDHGHPEVASEISYSLILPDDCSCSTLEKVAKQLTL